LIDEVRFDLAVPLLNDEALTITEIAYELGYANVAHFSRAFRRITGMSPRNYRNNSKEYKTRVGPM
jgi:AraC-like DNA-binding protein